MRLPKNAQRYDLRPPVGLIRFSCRSRLLSSSKPSPSRRHPATSLAGLPKNFRIIDTTIHTLFEAAFAAQQAGEFARADELYRRCLSLAPPDPDTLHFYGVLQAQINQPAIGIELISRAVALRPDDAVFRFNLALCLIQAGRADEALSQLEFATSLDPAYAAAHAETARLHIERGRWKEAVESCRAAVSAGWVDSALYLDCGRALLRVDRPAEAVEAFRRALELQPDFVEAHNNLGNVMVTLGRDDEAVEHYRRAAELQREAFEPCFNFGTLLMQQEKWEAARESLMDAWRLRNFSSDTAVVSSLLHCQQNLCDWSELERLVGIVVESVELTPSDPAQQPVSPMVFLSLPTATTSEQQQRCAVAWSKSKVRAPIARPGLPRPNQRIRVGYLSGDFNTHPVGYLIPELIESHDRSRFDVVGYSFGKDDGSFNRRRLEKAFDRFVDITGLSHRESAERIAVDQIDVLIDLQGHTRNSRIEILEYRPAPIQVAYLGFAATLGTKCIDYMIVDDFVVPPGEETWFTEKLIRLPGCFMVNDSRREIAAATPTRRELGLPDEAFVFCAFSAPFKLNPTMFEVWMRLLQAVPDSLLWLRTGVPACNENLRREANRHGVSPDRIVFAPIVPMADHLARHRAADLFLDTFPYNQHSSASDALRMGLPVLTRTGKTFASRVAGSLLTNLGFPELITESLEDYAATARRFAEHREELQAIRSRLATAGQDHELFDGRRFAKKFEAALESMIKDDETRETNVP